MFALPEVSSERDAPLVEQIVEQITRNIDQKTWHAGMRLPSIRQLAQSLTVSKFTVVEAYDRLVARGYLDSRRGAGFFVAHRSKPVQQPETESPVERAVDTVWLMRQMLLSDNDMLKAGCGWLPTDWLMTEDIRRALRTLSRTPMLRPTCYGLPAGYLPLRQQLQQKLADINIDARPSQILLTAGAMPAIDLILRYFLRPGDTALLDDPSYFNFRGNLKLHGVTLLPVPRTPQGPDLQVLERLVLEHRPRIYLTNSVLQNPMGTNISPGVAFKLLNLAHAHDFYIIEDDIYADLLNEPSSRLAALDQLQRVIYVGSFSKTLSANFRVGFITAQRDLIQELVDLKLLTGITSSEGVEQVVYQLLTEGFYRKHVDRVRGKLAHAMSRVRPALSRLGCEAVAEPAGGMFIWASLPPGVNACDLAASALQSHIVLAPGNLMSVASNANRFMRFNIAHCNEVVFDRLARLLESCTAPQPLLHGATMHAVPV